MATTTLLTLSVELRPMIFESLFDMKSRTNDWRALLLTSKSIYQEVAKIIHKAHLFVHIPTNSSVLAYEEFQDWCQSDDGNGFWPGAWFVEGELIDFFCQFASVHLELGVGAKSVCEKKWASQTLELVIDEAMEDMIFFWSDSPPDKQPSLKVTPYFDCECVGCRSKHESIRRGRSRFTGHVSARGACMILGALCFEDERRRHDSLRIGKSGWCEVSNKYLPLAEWEAEGYSEPNARPLEQEGFRLKPADD